MPRRKALDKMTPHVFLVLCLCEGRIGKKERNLYFLTTCSYSRGTAPRFGIHDFHCSKSFARKYSVISNDPAEVKTSVSVLRFLYSCCQCCLLLSSRSPPATWIRWKCKVKLYHREEDGKSPAVFMVHYLSAGAHCQIMT